MSHPALPRKHNRFNTGASPLDNSTRLVLSKHRNRESALGPVDSFLPPSSSPAVVTLTLTNLLLTLPITGVGLANTAPPAAPQHTQSFGSLSTAAASYTPSTAAASYTPSTAAASYTPGQAFQPPSTQEYGAAQQQQQVQPQSTLVSRNGQQFRVPNGLAGQYNPADQAQYDSVVGGIRGGEGSGFDGHDAEGWTWSNAATTHPHPLGIPPSLHSHYQTLTNLQSRTLPPSSHHYKSIPPKYHSAYPLSLGQESGSYGYPSSLFSVRSRDAEGWFVLRRFDVKCR